MQTPELFATLLSAWSMAIAYYEIEVRTGIEIELLLAGAIITTVIGLYLACRSNKETTKEEA